LTFGKVCLVLAALVAAYLAWLFWGTDILARRSQNGLRTEISQRIEHPRPQLPRDRKVVVPGDAMAILRIPRIDLDLVVVEGTDTNDLRKGPGHYPASAYPWDDAGRVAIAGHRTTYLRPFWSLDELRPGDRIVLETEFGIFRYSVDRVAEVPPDRLSVVHQTARPTLILSTCTPRFSATRRLIVFAVRNDHLARAGLIASPSAHADG
jgi:sortase A